MKLEFTKKEVDYFKENCYFTDEEEKILELRLRGNTIISIAFMLHLSDETVQRRIKSIKKKILKVI